VSIGNEAKTSALIISFLRLVLLTLTMTISEAETTDSSHDDNTEWSDDDSSSDAHNEEPLQQVIDDFIARQVNFRLTKKLPTYDLSDLQKYARKDVEWLRTMTMNGILRLCVRRNGDVASSWRRFHQFGLVEEYCAQGDTWSEFSAIRELIQNWYLIVC